MQISKNMSSRLVPNAGARDFIISSSNITAAAIAARI